MGSFRITIDDKEFKKSVDELLNLFKNKERKKILRKASRPLQKRMKAATEFFDYTGEARESIRTLTWANSNDYFVGPKTNVFPTKRPKSRNQIMFSPFYMYFIEYGWTNSWTNTWIPPAHFIRNAVNDSKNEVLAIIVKEVDDRIKPFGR